LFLKKLQRSSESDALQRSASYTTAERVRVGTDEIFTIRLSAAWVNMENANELPRPSRKCYLRVARRRCQGPQARGGGSSEAKSLDEVEHNSTLTM
jgi:hypothetical protein